MLQRQSGHRAAGGVAGEWDRDLTRSLGSIRAGRPSQGDLVEQLRCVYLPAWRNPLDELARREARVLIELLRAQQQRTDGTRNLSGSGTSRHAFRASADGLVLYRGDPSAVVRGVYPGALPHHVDVTPTTEVLSIRAFASAYLVAWNTAWTEG
jgi:hypothetical protein